MNIKSRNILLDEKAPVTALVLCGLDAMPLKEWLGDDGPEFLRHDLEELLGSSIPDSNWDRLQAGLSVLSSDSFDTDWVVFNNFCHLFNFGSVDFETFEPVSATDVTNTLAEARMIRGSVDYTGLELSDEVKALIGQVFVEYGLCQSPVFLRETLMPSTQREKDAEISEACKEKEEALKEVYDTRIASVMEYVETKYK